MPEPTPTRVQRRRAKGWRMPLGTVYVGRPSKWGNPFTVTAERTVEECVDLFRFTTEPVPGRPGWFTTVDAAEIDVRPLRGKNLACWCPLNQPCHADVLLEIANA